VIIQEAYAMGGNDFFPPKTDIAFSYELKIARISKAKCEQASF
jgi:hypothetical protein